MKNSKFLYLLIAGLVFFSITACVESSTETTNGSVKIGVEEAEEATRGGDKQFIDVRTTGEFAASHPAHSKNYPLDMLTEKLGELNKNEPVYVSCQSGSRSTRAAKILLDNGFTEVYEVAGGMNSWTSANLPVSSGK